MFPVSEGNTFALLKKKLVIFSFLLSLANVPTTVTSWGFPALGIEAITAPTVPQGRAPAFPHAVWWITYFTVIKEANVLAESKNSFLPLSASLGSHLPLLWSSTRRPCILDMLQLKTSCNILFLSPFYIVWRKKNPADKNDCIGARWGMHHQS